MQATHLVDNGVANARNVAHEAEACAGLATNDFAVARVRFQDALHDVGTLEESGLERGGVAYEK